MKHGVMEARSAEDDGKIFTPDEPSLRTRRMSFSWVAGLKMLFAAQRAIGSQTLEQGAHRR
jgi:hypothetical protein